MMDSKAIGPSGSSAAGRRIVAGVLLVLVVAVLVAAFFLPDPRPIVVDFESGAALEEHWILDADDDCRLSETDAEVRIGKRALRIEAPIGLRCELVPRVYSDLMYKFLREPFGEPRVYRFSVFVDTHGSEDVSDDLGDNTVVAQWHASADPVLDGDIARGPPLALRIHNNRWGVTYGWDEKLRSTERYLANRWQWLGTVQTGRWIDWEFRVAWSHGEDGLTEVYRDGQLVFRRAGPNTYNDLRGVYLKLGLYHPVTDSVMYLDRVAVIDGTASTDTPDAE